MKTDRHFYYLCVIPIFKEMKKLFIFLSMMFGLSFASCFEEEETDEPKEEQLSEEEQLAELAKKQGVSVTGRVGEYTYVDLGLSVMWATYNVGASLPIDDGDLFAWGETSPKTVFTNGNYKLTNVAGVVNKYYGNDNQKVLVPQDDVATQRWGEAWRMPTSAEMIELRQGCEWTLVEDFNDSGVDGMLGKSRKNGNVIFLPTAGWGDEEGRGARSNGYYWSSSVSLKNDGEAWYTCFGTSYIGLCEYALGRSNGLSIRPVHPKEVEE